MSVNGPTQVKAMIGCVYLDVNTTLTGVLSLVQEDEDEGKSNQVLAKSHSFISFAV